MKVYHLTSSNRIANRMLGAFIRLGVMPDHLVLLTVAGRKPGKVYTSPVALVIVPPF